MKSKPTTYRNEDAVKRINKGVSLCASKYQLLSVLNISLPLTQGRLIKIIMPPI